MAEPESGFWSDGPSFVELDAYGGYRDEARRVQCCPPGTYARGARSPIVYVLLCPVCAGYAPTTDEDYCGTLTGRCQGCGAYTRELHRFQALILSAANGGCMCDSGHPQVTGDLPTEESANAVMLEVRTRPAPRPARTGGA